MCDRPARKAGLCWGHWWRKLKGKPIAAELKEYAENPVEGLYRAAIEYANATDGDEEEHRLARERFRDQKRRAWVAYLARLTGLASPRMVRRQTMGDVVTLTFRNTPRPDWRKRAKVGK